MTSAVSAPSWSFDCFGVEVEVTDAEEISVAAIADLPEFGLLPGECAVADSFALTRVKCYLEAGFFVQVCSLEVDRYAGVGNSGRARSIEAVGRDLGREAVEMSWQARIPK
jgi:hypothetical protein